MAVTMLDGTSGAVAAPQTPVPQQTAGHYATTAADIPSARVAARLSGKQVEALAERTETSTTWVNANGSLTTEVSAGPIRFKDNGQWRPVDLDLVQNGDGSIAPKAHPRGLKLAGGGGTTARSLTDAGTAPARDLVTLGAGDQQIALQWKGGLPKPTLSGTRATYVNAVPGANLVVEATRTGFEQFVDIAQRPAAGGFAYTLPLKTKGLSVKQLADGSLQFTDAKNNKQAVMPAPTMWDAQVDPVSGLHTHQAPVALKVVAHKGSVDLVFTPDTKFLADPSTKFPVTVDPSTATLGNVFDTYAQQGVTVDESTDTELDLGNPGTTNTDGTPRTARSFITWNTAPFADALVTNAKLSLWDFHAGNNVDCAAYPWEVWDVDKASTSTRWPAQPVWHTKSATSTETRGNPSCTAAPDGWINADVTTLAQTWASLKNATSGMGLRASSETVIAQWKRVNSANAATNPPKLVVTYNYRPRTGTDQQAGPPFFKDTTGTWQVNTLTPTLRDTFADPNNDKVDGTFQIFDNTTGTQVGNLLVSPYVPAGQPASVTVPAGLLTNGKTYKFHTNSYDGTHYNLGWSPYALFTVDTSAPSAPTSVTSTDYPSSAWVKGVGQSGNFTVTPPAGDQSGVEWSLDGTTWTKISTGGSATPVVVAINPTKAGTNTLQVRSTDKAENKSESVSYTFHVGPGGVTSPDEGTRTAARVPLTAEADSSKYDHVAFSWRRGDADTWTPVPAGDVANSGTALQSWPVALSGGKSPQLTWNATSTVNPDSTVQVRADFTGPNNSAVSSDPISVIVDRTADGATTDSIGPGAVNLLTGDYTLSRTDASFFGMTVSRTSSSRSPQAGAGLDGQAPIFGTQWLSGTTAETTNSDYTEIRKTSNTSLDVVISDGSTIKFTANASQNGWVPETGAEDLTLTGAFASGDFTLSDTGGTVTTFTKVGAAATTWTVSSSLLDGLTNSTTKVVSEAVVLGGKTLARPKRIISATTATTLAACDADPSIKGCRVLEFTYATTTTATGSATSADFGDYTGQVSSIKLWATAPSAASATATTVAQYRYDIGGSLRQEWDPRLAQNTQTQYAYDSAGRVTYQQDHSLLPWNFTYGQVGTAATAGPGMLLTAYRSTLAPGSASTTNGTATTTVVYGVPLTGTSAPNDLGPTATASWGQSDLPTDATAVFPADQVPASNDGTTLDSGSYTRATLHYLDASAQEVNKAEPGHHITATEYDRYGNTIRSLNAGNRELALGTTTAQKSELTDLGINALSAGERAQLLSTTSVYDATGQRVTDTYGPLHQVALAANLVSGSTTVATAGTGVTARAHTLNEYDTGRPTDGTATVKNQVTKQTTGAQARAWPDLLADPRVTTTGYDWVKGLPTSTTKDPGSLALTTTTAYDDQGRVTQTTQPASTGTDAGATTTTYYTGTGSAPCGGRPEWADTVCQTAPAAAIAGGGTNPTQLPTTTTQYNVWGDPTVLTETANSVTRTTTTGYDGAGRPTTVTITGGLGTAVPAVTTAYDTATGAVLTQTSTAGGTITKTYDQLGRQMSYTDADGATTSTQYDTLDRPTTVTDTVPSTTTYTYDTALDPRGITTKVSDSVAGPITATYDADGDLASQGLPGGYTMTENQDPIGEATTRTYTRNGDGTVLVSDSITETINGQWATHTGTPGVTASQNYTYDKIGRLTQAQDTGTDAVCTTRSYTFDKNTNRKTLNTATAGPNADCTTTGGTTVTNTYDTADRLVNSGYTYDALGRTSAKPGTALAYYANDLAQQQTAGTQRQTWTIDSALRFRTYTTESNNAGTWTQTGSKVNHYDSTSDIPRWVTEDTAGSITRDVDGLDGNIAATTTKTGGTILQLANLHGDITMQLPVDTSVAPTVLDADEYGNPRAGQIATRYAWLGGKQRSDETPTGLTLMGVRLYDPTTGRFLSTDPVPGGSSNAYDYANQDPLNGLDLDGRTARGNQRSSEFKDWSDTELEHFYRQPSTPKAMKQKIKKEQKARGSRGSRSSNSKKSQGRNNRQHHRAHHHLRTYAKWGLGGLGVAAAGAACFFGGCEIVGAGLGLGALGSWAFSW
ncbi:RHS repeat-associated core domain-containing protein [Streptomyces sp. SID13666]|uniref:RHS repeat-associated core domain-containing protein n=1 Tax=Streptomyces TaxID=1883 RepID=UPI0013C09C33|nr:RHS repeat-associated core domain-containing protein [Streptomyces sp. SID13666]NEA55620.1 RHS repeat-associated core domain-containing protein [Streptomyces sp. SID13666]